MGELGKKGGMEGERRSGPNAGSRVGKPGAPVREKCIRGFAWESPGIIQDRTRSPRIADTFASLSATSDRATAASALTILGLFRFFLGVFSWS